MNPVSRMLSQIEEEQHSSAQRVRGYNQAVSLFMSRNVKFSDSVCISASLNYLWLEVTTAEDKAEAMKLAPKGKFWKKQSGYNGALEYNVEIDNYTITVSVRDGALPPTCEVVEEEVEVPAQPARKQTKKVVRCKQAPAEVEEGTGEEVTT